MNIEYLNIEHFKTDIRRKYHGKRRRLRHVLSKERKRVKQFFTSLLNSEKDRIKVTILKHTARMNLVIEEQLSALCVKMSKPETIKMTDKVQLSGTIIQYYFIVKISDEIILKIRLLFLLV